MTPDGPAAFPAWKPGSRPSPKRRKSVKYELLSALDPDPGRYAAEDPSLAPGDHVKLGFRVDPAFRATYRGEWMFLEVTKIKGRWPNAVYRGELCDRPLLIRPAVLRVGQPVEFRAEHICVVVHDSPARPEGEREAPPGSPPGR
jgi:hypothetical protein